MTDTLFDAAALTPRPAPGLNVWCSCNLLLQHIPAHVTYSAAEVEAIHAEHTNAAGCDLRIEAAP